MPANFLEAERIASTKIVVHLIVVQHVVTSSSCTRKRGCRSCASLVRGSISAAASSVVRHVTKPPASPKRAHLCCAIRVPNSLLLGVSLSDGVSQASAWTLDYRNPL